jgi:hypothetical protein
VAEVTGSIHIKSPVLSFFMFHVSYAIFQKYIRYERLQIRGWKLEEVSEVVGSIHISSPVRFLFFHFSFFMFHVAYVAFQKYIRHEQCEFPQEDV